MIANRAQKTYTFSPFSKDRFAVNLLTTPVFRWFFALLAALWLVQASLANEAPFGQIELADNLQQDGQLASTEKKPIVLFVTASYCEFCEILREEIFQFLPKDPRFILRELVIDSEFPLKDFSGNKMNHGVFSDQLNTTLTPTVLFLDGKGENAAEAMVGVLTLDFYNYYFEENLTKARETLKSGTN